jgi:hypothetical protein
MTKREKDKNLSLFLLNRLTRRIPKSIAERKRSPTNKLSSLSALLFCCGKGTFANIFVGYQPDSHAYFHKHPEFYTLFQRFKKRNKLNNAGDVARLWSFILNIKQIISEGIEGDFAEVGVWRGNTAAVLAHFASKTDRQVCLFDTYEGFHKKDLQGIDSNQSMAFDDTSLKLVIEVIGEDSAVCEFVKGYFPESIADKHRLKSYSAVSLDCDLYEPMKAGLSFFYPLMPRGALFLLHDYSSLSWPGAKKAIDEFCEETEEHLILMPDKSGSAFIRKSGQYSPLRKRGDLLTSNPLDFG